MTSRRASLLVSSLVLALAPAARAFGPGVHSREAQVVLARLAASDPAMAALAAHPLARSWLTLGAIAPDFMFMSASLGMGHEPGLSHHLRAAAADLDPEHRLFALGHTCHVASDGASEAFVVPALFGSVPIGATDLFADQPAYKEAEGVVESLGDLLTGDWGAVVNLLYDLWLGPPEARARFDEIFAWYCTTGAAYLGRQVDCAAARAELGVTLGRLEAALAPFDRAGAHAFIADMIALPVPELIELALELAGDGGGLGGLVAQGLGAGPSPEAEAELAFLLTTPLVDRAFWSGYEALADLGPSFALARIADGTSGWPSYDIPGIESGLLASYFQFLPDELDVTPGLMIDELVFRGPDGRVITQVEPALAGRTLTASLRVYSAHPLAATLHARVRKARPGLASAHDPVVGATTIDVDIDPRDYARAPRTTIVVPFTADTEGALGFDVELAVGDARPTLTTSRDRLWTSDALDLASPSFVEILTTSPRALPVAAPSAPPAAPVVVEVAVAPAGPGIEGATVGLGQGASAATTPMGFVVFDEVAPGPYMIVASAPGYADPEPVALEVPANGWAPVRARLALHARPRIEVGRDGWSASADGLEVRIDPAPFQGQARAFVVTALADGGEPAAAGELPGSGSGLVPFVAAVDDCAPLRVTARARYDGGALGVVGEVDARLDRTPPELAASLTPETTPACAPDGAGTWTPAATLVVSAADACSRIAELAWRDEGGWSPIVSPSTPLPAGDAPVIVRARDGAGHVVEVTLARPGPVVLPACDPPEAPAEPSPEPATADAEALAEAEDAGPRGESDAGCGLGASGSALALLALAVRPRALSKRRGSR